MKGIQPLVLFQVCFVNLAQIQILLAVGCCRWQNFACCHECCFIRSRIQDSRRQCLAKHPLQHRGENARQQVRVPLQDRPLTPRSAIQLGAEDMLPRRLHRLRKWKTHVCWETIYLWCLSRLLVEGRTLRRGRGALSRARNRLTAMKLTAGTRIAFESRGSIRPSSNVAAPL